MLYLKPKKIFFKADLIVKLSSNGLISIDFLENTQQLITEYSDIEKIMQLEDKFLMTKIIYFNKKNIHYLLYETENIININYFNQKLACYFYLDLLLLENPNIINYNYSIDFIHKIVNYGIKNNYKIKIIDCIYSKIIIDIIYNYKRTDVYKDEEEEELNIMKNKAIYIIKNKSFLFKEFGLSESDILNQKIDELYANIIMGLLRNNRFQEYEYTYDIIEQLDLENIVINQYMFDKFYKIFIEEEKLYTPFFISDINNLINIKYLNFYYLLIKYILKNSIYIYQIPFLLKTRENIIKIINNIINLNQLCELKINESESSIIEERRNYVIKTITDSEYYYKKYLKSVNDYNLKKLKQILNYYETFLSESKKSDINTLKNIIDNQQIENYDKYLKEYETAYKMNCRKDIIFYLFDLELKNEKIEEYQLNRFVNKWNLIEEMVKNKKYKGEYKLKLINFFNEQKNKNLILNIFNEDEIKLFIRENNILFDIKKEEILNNEKKEDKISNNINEIEKVIINKEVKNNDGLIGNKLNCKNQNEEKSKRLFYIYEESYLYKRSSKYEIISSVKIIGNHNISEIVKNLSYGHYISSGADNKLLLYNKNFELKLKIGVNDWPYNIYEMDKEKEKSKSKGKKEINLVISCGKEVIIIAINVTNYMYETQRYIISYTKSFFLIDFNKYILLTDKGVYHITNLFSNNQKDMKFSKLINNEYRNGIKITNNIYAFTSNNISPLNENSQLIFYNIMTRKTIKAINDYSFILTSNGLCLISNEKDSLNNKILLCGCKKYNPEDKNGILLVNLTLEKKEKFFYVFYDTESFEVFCFCQIFKVQNENYIDEDITFEENIKKEKTDYILVGGYDNEKMEGMIKLYRIMYNKKNDNDEIKLNFIQDVSMGKNDKFYGFENAVSCIIQSEITGNVITSCWDGKVLLFTPPNIDFYINY